MILTGHQCALPYCERRRFAGFDRCVLHVASADKDLDAFSIALDQHIQNTGYLFNGIYFPERFILSDDPEGNIRFLNCRFSGGIVAKKRQISSQVNIEYCEFEGPALFEDSHFEEDAFFINNTFRSSFSLIGTGFHGNTFLGFNDFQHGANFYRTGFDTERRFVIRNCRMGYTLFQNCDVRNIEFVLCQWNRSFKLAEEQYALTVKVGFGEFSIPDTYLNRMAVWLHKHLLLPDVVLRFLFPREYVRQQNLAKCNGSAYLIHGSGNDSLMAENTYRNLRLQYSGQGEPEIAGQFFYREKVTQRRQKNHLSRIWDYFSKEVLFGYGERPMNVLMSSGILTVLFAWIYAGSENLIHGNVVTTDVLSALYFSVVTFTTLGYGDYHPVGWLRFLSAFEALLGAVFIALFIVTMTRKFIR